MMFKGKKAGIGAVAGVLGASNFVMGIALILLAIFLGPATMVSLFKYQWLVPAIAIIFVLSLLRR